MPILILMLFSQVAGEATGAIQMHTNGGAYLSYTSEKVTLTPEGKATFETISPYPLQYSQPNRVGKYETMVGPEKYSSLLELIQSAKKDLAKREIAQERTEIIEELSIPGKTFTFSPNDKDAKLAAIRSALGQLRQAASAKPVSALELHCEKKSKSVDCHLKNVGSTKLTTVDPMQVGNAIFCVAENGSRSVLVGHTEYDPNQMHPGKIVIEGGDKFSFSFPVLAPCQTRILVKTTDMLVNREYRDLLVGELVSNPL